MNNKKIKLHLISDYTGETLGSIARAVLSQFENVETNDFIWSLTCTKTKKKIILPSLLQPINNLVGKFLIKKIIAGKPVYNKPLNSRNKF